MQVVREGIVARWRGLFALLAGLVIVFAIAARHDGTDKLARNVAAADSGESAPARTSPDDCARLLDVVPQPDWLDPPDPVPATAEIRHPGTIDPNGVVAEFDVARNGDWFLVPVIMGGRKYEFLIDTGCSVCVVDNDLEPVLHETGETCKFNGKGGFAVYRLPQAFLGKCKLSVDGPVICLDLEPFRELTGHDIRGILGMTFLKQHLIQMDFDAGKLAFLRTCPPDAGHRFQLSYTRSNTPALELNVGQDEFIPFEIDTGSQSSRAGQLGRSTFQRLTRDGQLVDTGKTVGYMTALGPEYQRIGLLWRLQLDPFAHTNLEFTESATNRLGLGYLSRYVITFDFPNDSVYLRKGKRYAHAAKTLRRKKIANPVFLESGFFISGWFIAGREDIERGLSADFRRFTQIKDFRSLLVNLCQSAKICG